jgi:hypothetical protein
MEARPEFIGLELTKAAAVTLFEWLSIVPVELIPVTDPAERQALMDLLYALEWAAPEPTAEVLLAARQLLLKNSGDWVYQGATYSPDST